MANNSAIVNSFQQPNSAHHCKECGLFFDSAKSLEVHLQYHKENLLNKWANQAAAAAQSNHDQETNNNNSKSIIGGPASQRAITAAADSSDAMLAAKTNNKSPDSYNNRTTPETSTTSFGHPPTPQSYNSAPSPYQSHAEGNTTYSPTTGYQSNAQNYQQQVKNERASPSQYGSGNYHQQMYPSSNEQQQYFSGMEQQQLGYPQDYPVHKIPHGASSASFRYHPYGYERSPQVTSSSPAYTAQNSQPTPSPSPKQCDKCGCVCDSAAQLLDHLNHAHPQTPSPHHQHMQFNTSATTPSHLQQQQNQFNFGAAIDSKSQTQHEIKTENEEPQSEILDLDSHKVHHVFQTPEEEEELKRNGEMSHANPHSVSAMLGTWPGTGSPKMYSPNGGPAPGMFTPEQKHIYQPHPLQMPCGEYIVHGVSTTSQDQAPPMGGGMMGQYRPFEQLPPQPTAPVISSTQLAGPGIGGPSGGGQSSKSTNWKSNEARRPKTYNCSACNKWFTSSGHLKRHYNTTLHKNAVKSSGQPDPATMPISVHHHPGREERSGGRGGNVILPDSNNHSPDSADDTRGGDDSGLSPAYDRGVLQQPPAGPYDRQPGLALGPGPGPPLHSPMGGSPVLANLSSGSPPNGEAGPSVTPHQDHLSRGLLSISTVPSSHQQHLTNNQLGETQQPGFNLFSQGHMMAPLHSADTTNSNSNSATPPAFMHPMQQMQSSMVTSYPNASAPHVTPPTATNNQQPVSISLTITGDQPYELYVPHQMQPEHAAEFDQQPLPSFAQFQTAHHRYGILLAPPGYQGLHAANVGGTGPVTDPIYLQTHDQLAAAVAAAGGYVRQQPSPTEDYEITVLENAAVDPLAAYSPPSMTELPASPQDSGISLAVTVKSEPKSDYEHGSPQITSTGSPLGAGKTTMTSTLGSGAMPNGQHKCFDCDKVFNKACYLTQHNKTFHSGDKPFKCHRCGKRFSSDQSYQEHSAKHAPDKPYKCELCPKQFNHKTDLRRHMCLHTGQKPYACDHCGKGFIRKDHMLKHAETHTRKSHHHHHNHQKQQVVAS